MIDTVVRKFNNWKRFRQTYDELSNLSNRELDDLGIARADIARYARMSAIKVSRSGDILLPVSRPHLSAIQSQGS